MLRKYARRPVFSVAPRRLRPPVWSVILLVVSALSGCARSASRERDGEESLERKLARLGLEVISEREAGIPASERGKFLPCRSLEAGRARPLLPPHPAGYLIVGVEGQASGDVGSILEVLARWRRGETISLWLRRNHYLAPDADWWEVNEMPVTLP